MRFCVCLVAAIALGCHRPVYVEPAPNGVVVKSDKIGMYRKEVIEKKDPDTLIAADATICRVSPDLYKSASLHSIVYCNWQ